MNEPASPRVVRIVASRPGPQERQFRRLRARRRGDAAPERRSIPTRWLVSRPEPALAAVVRQRPPAPEPHRRPRSHLTPHHRRRRKLATGLTYRSPTGTVMRMELRPMVGFCNGSVASHLPLVGRLGRPGSQASTFRRRQQEGRDAHDADQTQDDPHDNRAPSRRVGGQDTSPQNCVDRVTSRIESPNPRHNRPSSRLFGDVASRAEPPPPLLTLCRYGPGLRTRWSVTGRRSCGREPWFQARGCVARSRGFPDLSVEAGP